MGSIYYVERNGQKYAYESTSKRVPGKKNPRTEKKYLGKVDPETGRIVPKVSRKRPAEEYAKFYGTVEVLDGIQRKMGILDDLGAVFPGLSGNIMGAAMSQAINPTSFDSIHYVVDGSVMKEKMKLRGSLSPSSVGELSEKLGTYLTSMDRFFMLRIARSSSEFYSLDLTSVSSYSDMQGWAQWGHNRDGEDLRQTNIAMVTDAEGIPVMFRMLPGSVADSAVMRCTVDDMKRMGCCGRLVMDRGFESASNIRSLLEMGVDFTVPSNVRAEPIKKLLSMAIADLKVSSAFCWHEGSSYKVAEYEVGVYGNDEGCGYVIRVPQNHKDSRENNLLFDSSKKLKAFVVYDAKKAADDINTIMSAVKETELKYENTRHEDPDSVYSGLHPFIRRYVDYSVGPDGIMHIHRKQNAFAFADNRAGMFVMLASSGTTWEEMMASYDVRDWVEKAFDVYKNDLDGSRSRTGDPDRARGRLFIKFIALMLRVRIRNILREHDGNVLSTKAKKDSVNGMTVDEVLMSLSTLMAVGNTGDWRLTVVTKNVREIFRLFGLPEPESGQILLA